MRRIRGRQRALVALGAAVSVAAAGCARNDREVFARPELHAADRPAESAGGAPSAALAQADSVPAPRRAPAIEVRIVDPAPGARVPQFGAAVRLQIRGQLAAGEAPVVFVRDGTGSEVNWWPQGPAWRDAGGQWICPVGQFGVPEDTGRRFAIVVLVLPAGQTPAVGSVGALPASAAARSELVEVIRR